MKNRKDAIEIFMAGVDSVRPDNLIRNFVSLEETNLKIDTLKFDLQKVKNIYIVGAGKASATMAHTMEDVLGEYLTGGHVVTKYDHAVPLKKVGVTEAGHPVPDENGLKGTEKILEIAKNASENDLVICLLSGGGSALMADVPESCTLSDLKAVNDSLLRCGASIGEMNCIRKHLSRVKGGQLAKTIAPAIVVSLILSDVVGDPLDVIASGPTAPDPTSFEDAIQIIKGYGLENTIPSDILSLLQSGFEGKRSETLKASDEILNHTHNLIIGSNKLALKEAARKAESLGYEAEIISNTLQGDVSTVASYIVEIARNTKKVKGEEKICLLFAGEPTVKVTTSGLGGRNQHLALLAAQLLKGETDFTILSGGTDGFDGPTDAAGAVVDAETHISTHTLNLSIDEYIQNCDSYHFFEKVGGLIRTGPTKTNVMDIIIVLIE